jgi:hypothetical protein
MTSVTEPHSDVAPQAFQLAVPVSYAEPTIAPCVLIQTLKNFTSVIDLAAMPEDIAAEPTQPNSSSDVFVSHNASQSYFPPTRPPPGRSRFGFQAAGKCQ